nr:hypothetical protein [Sphingomonas beigongshangi]
MRILLALSLVATAAAPMARDTVPVATPAGPPLACIPLAQIRETRVRDDRTIDFVANRARIYRNTLPAACPGLGFERRFAYATSLSQLCAADLITVLQSPDVMPGARCGLGPFQPVTLVDPRR